MVHSLETSLYHPMASQRFRRVFICFRLSCGQAGPCRRSRLSFIGYRRFWSQGKVPNCCAVLPLHFCSCSMVYFEKRSLPSRPGVTMLLFQQPMLLNDISWFNRSLNLSSGTHFFTGKRLAQQTGLSFEYDSLLSSPCGLLTTVKFLFFLLHSHKCAFCMLEAHFWICYSIKFSNRRLNIKWWTFWITNICYIFICLNVLLTFWDQLISYIYV